MTTTELLRKGYAILEGEADDNMTKEEWRAFQEARDEAEMDEFLEGEDEFYNWESPQEDHHYGG